MISTALKTGLSRPSSVALVARNGRSVGSKCRCLTTKAPQKPPARPTKPAPPKTGMAALENEFSNPSEVTVEVTPEMKMANASLAVVLLGFVGGVWYYSMQAVGSQEKDGDDPLAQLKMEAQEAMERQEKELNPDDKAKQLLQEFSRGDHDPDKAELDALEELERLDAEEGKKKKKSWWKFW